MQSKTGIFAFVSKQRMRFAGNQGSAAQQATLRQRCTLITNIPYSSKSRKGYFLQSTRKPDFPQFKVFWRVWDPFFQKRVLTYPLQTSLATSSASRKQKFTAHRRCKQISLAGYLPSQAVTHRGGRMKSPQFKSFLEVLGPFFSKKGPNVPRILPQRETVWQGAGSARASRSEAERTRI